MKTIGKYWGLTFFLVLNTLIIVLAQTLDGGTLLYNTGIIHIIALGFVGLALIRVFYHYYTYDPILEKFIHATLAAMGIFAFSHIVEFLSMTVLHQYADAVYINVANYYLISLLVISLGTEYFLGVLYSHSPRMNRVIYALIAGLVLLSGALIINDRLISLNVGSYTPIIYTVATLAVIVFNLYKMRQIKRGVDFMPGFVNYLSVSIVLIGVAALSNVYYVFFTDIFNLPEYQAVYFSHFAFYIALSFLFLAFGKVSHLGGMLEEVKNMHLKK